MALEDRPTISWFAVFLFFSYGKLCNISFYTLAVFILAKWLLKINKQFPFDELFLIYYIRDIENKLLMDTSYLDKTHSHSTRLLE